MKTIRTITHTVATTTIETVVHDGPAREFKDALARRFADHTLDVMDAGFDVSAATMNLRRVLEDLETFRCLKLDKAVRLKLHHCQPNEVKKYKRRFPGIASAQIARLLHGYITLTLRDVVDTDDAEGVQLNEMIDAVSLAVTALDLAHHAGERAAPVIEDALRLAIAKGTTVMDALHEKRTPEAG